jgi:hypothetical protein
MAAASHIHRGVSLAGSPPSKQVLVVVEGLQPAAHAEAAVRRIGWRPRRADLRELSEKALCSAGAIVYDGQPIGDLPGTLTEIRKLAPRLPIVLYLHFPPHLDVVGTLLAVAPVLHVTGCGQTGSLTDVDRLAPLLWEHCTSVPEREVRGVIENLLPNLPSLHRAFIRAVLHARARAQPCSVETVANELRLHPDILRRHWSQTPLGRPKDLLRRVTWLFATYMRDWAETDGEDLAVSMGISLSTLRRMEREYMTAGQPTDFAHAVIVAAAAWRPAAAGR